MSKIKGQQILLLGSIPIKGMPSSFGGATILMASLKNYFESLQIDHTFIQLNRPFGKFSFLKNYLSTIIQIFKNLKNTDVVFLNASSNGAFFLSPIVFLIAKTFGKKFILRLFGSNFEQVYKNQKGIFRFLFKNTALKSDLVIVETKVNVQCFEVLGAKEIYWLPNVRSKQSIEDKEPSFKKRFVFISHVKESKGVMELIQAADALDDSYTIDVYGPVFDEFDLKAFDNSSAKYKGTLTPEQVISTLKEYNVLVLPTYYKEEGYPGIVIEAMSLGIPCISTFWNSIPEIIEDGYNGILVPIKNQQALRNAMQHYDKKNYNIFVKNTLKKFSEFDEIKVYERLLLKLEKLKNKE